MKITIDSRDLAYTIDTYGMFNGESVGDNEAEYYHDEYGIDAGDISFTYDHPEVVKALAKSSVDLLSSELVNRFDYSDELPDGTRTKVYDGIVKSITLKDTKSPQFYNYTTDSYAAEWDIDRAALETYIAKNRAAYESWARESQWGDDVLPTYWNGKPNANYNDENAVVAMLDYYTRNAYSNEEYNDSMFEHEHEAWYENMKPDADTQAKIDAVIAAREGKK